MPEPKTFHILCTEESYYSGKSPSKVYPRVAQKAEFKLTDASAGDDLLKALQGIDAVIMRKGEFTREIFARSPRLRGVVKWGVGVETIDVPGATAEGVVIANSPGNSIAVAEASFLLLLAVSKNFLVMSDSVRSGKWQPAFDVRGREIFGKTLGIIGLGRIGHHLASIAMGAGMRVVAYDPYVALQNAEKLGVTLLDLDDLLRTSDAVSIHALLTEETHHLIGTREFGLMKPTAWLINTARGPIVDETALIEALRAGTIAGAGLDVFEQEPISPDNPLLSMPNVVCSPHALARTWESAQHNIEMIQDAILALVENRLPETCLNPTVEWRFANQRGDRS
jgi:D-3-phosphoglycerate dehydrogenase